MKRKLTKEQELTARLLEQFNRLPGNFREAVIWYVSGVADTASCKGACK